MLKTLLFQLNKCLNNTAESYKIAHAHTHTHTRTHTRVCTHTHTKPRCSIPEWLGRRILSLQQIEENREMDNNIQYIHMYVVEYNTLSIRKRSCVLYTVKRIS